MTGSPNKTSKDPGKNSLNNMKKSAQHKHPRFRENVYGYFREFSDNTGIHGFKYMGERERSITEKIYWLSVFCISLYFCLYLIIQTWIKWDKSPVLVSLSERPIPVWDIPFPAVTVCPETKIRQRVYNFTKHYLQLIDNYTLETFDEYCETSVICKNRMCFGGETTMSYERLEELIKNIKTKYGMVSVGKDAFLDTPEPRVYLHVGTQLSRTFRSTILQMSPPFEDIFCNCLWSYKYTPCKNLFSPVLTEEGLCFTFNMLDKSELLTNHSFIHANHYMSHKERLDGWSLENGYPPNADENTFPRRSMTSQKDTGLYLFLRTYEQDMDYMCHRPAQGFKIFLHHPAEFPGEETYYFRASVDQEIIVEIKPEITTTSAALKNYDPYHKKCFFQEERHLKFFQNYTQQNCQLECIANYTLNRCGCVTFHIPHDASTKICSHGSISCESDAKREMLIHETESELPSFENVSLQIPRCYCLPACVSVMYKAEISQSDSNWNKALEAQGGVDFNISGARFTQFNIFFKNMQFISSTRNELYGQIDFVANCGGLLGLFTGFSFLSIVELVYFLSLRLMCNIKKYGIHYWSGSQNIVQNPA